VLLWYNQRDAIARIKRFVRESSNTENGIENEKASKLVARSYNVTRNLESLAMIFGGGANLRLWKRYVVFAG
jgi:hypothetical protein